MEWWLALLIILGGLLVAFAAGMPVALAFMLINVIGAIFWWGGEPGLRQLSHSIYVSVADFTLLPIPLFILMGLVIFESGMGNQAIEALDKLMGRMPGRLGLLAVGSGVLLGTLSGSSMASDATLGAVLTPEMEKRGYKKPMSLGPIMGSAGLAIMIPPSSMAVLVAALAETSVAAVLIGGIIPGLMMAFLYASYITVRCWLQPSIAPAYMPLRVSLSEKMTAIAKNVLPLGIIIFMVTGVIFMGIATPSEAAATGLVGSVLVAAGYRRLNWGVMKKALIGGINISVMNLLIIAGAKSFSKILCYSGAGLGLAGMVTASGLAPIWIIGGIQLILIFMGMFAGQLAIIMITLPIVVPMLETMGLSVVWFCLLLLLNVEMATTTPPFGVVLFVMKGVAPPDTTMGDIYKAGIPFLLCDLIVLILMLFFPIIVLWLPSVI